MSTSSQLPSLSNSRPWMTLRRNFTRTHKRFKSKRTCRQHSRKRKKTSPLTCSHPKSKTLPTSLSTTSAKTPQSKEFPLQMRSLKNRTSMMKKSARHRPRTLRKSTSKMFLSQCMALLGTESAAKTRSTNLVPLQLSKDLIKAPTTILRTISQEGLSPESK